MVQTASTMVELGTSAPNFSLPSTDGTMVSLDDFRDAKVFVTMFICNHCPFVIHIAPALAKLAEELTPQGVQFVAINSNDITAYPDDNMEKMIEEKSKRNYVFPYLLDETQETAKTYTAACTPDFFVFDSNKSLVYRGQFDETRPHRISSGNYDSSQSPATGENLKSAIVEALEGKTISQKQYPSLGCNIKWKQGNEPTYFG